MTNGMGHKDYRVDGFRLPLEIGRGGYGRKIMPTAAELNGFET